jgi:hypothetical protein
MASLRVPKRRREAVSRTPASFVSSNLPLFGFGPRDALVQALRELTENSLDSGAGSVSVRLRLVPVDEGGVPALPGGWALWEIAVEDDGRGVADAALLHGVFSTTKAGGCVAAAPEAAAGAAPPATAAATAAAALGRYGVGLKAAILFAQSSVASLLRSAAGVAAELEDGGGGGGGSRTLSARARCPLLAATSLAGEQGVRAAHLGVDAADGTPREEPVAAAPTRLEGRAGGGGTAVALTFAYPAGTPASGAAAGELAAYCARLAFAPRQGATVHFSLGGCALAALLPPRGGAAPPPPADAAAAAAAVWPPPWAAPPGALRPAGAGGFTLRADGEASGDEAMHRFGLCQRAAVPPRCVARGEAAAAGGGRVVVWALLAPLAAAGGARMGGGSRAAPVHVLRFAEGVPLLRNAHACALTRGAVEGVAWAAEFGLRLEPLQRGGGSGGGEEGGGGGGGGGGGRLTARATAALLARFPAAPATCGRVDTAAVDGPGAFLAASAVEGYPDVPWEGLRLLVDARGGSTGGLSFGDLTKTHLLSCGGGGERGDGDGGRGGGGGGGDSDSSLAGAAADATLTAMRALRSQQPPGFLLPAEQQQRALLVRVYLPGVVAALEGALVRVGAGSLLAAGVARLMAAGGGGGSATLAAAVTAQLRRKLGAFAAAALGGGGGAGSAVAAAAAPALPSAAELLAIAGAVGGASSAPAAGGAAAADGGNEAWAEAEALDAWDEADAALARLRAAELRGERREARQG